jgi:hypothetical protein
MLFSVFTTWFSGALEQFCDGIFWVFSDANLGPGVLAIYPAEHEQKRYLVHPWHEMIPAIRRALAMVYSTRLSTSQRTSLFQYTLMAPIRFANQ